MILWGNIEIQNFDLRFSWYMVLKEKNILFIREKINFSIDQLNIPKK